MQMNYSFLCLHSCLYKNCFCSFYSFFFSFNAVMSFLLSIIICTITHGNTALISADIGCGYFSFRYFTLMLPLWELLLYLLELSVLVVTILIVFLSSSTTSRSLVQVSCHLKTSQLQTLYLSPFSIIMNSYSLVQHCKKNFFYT